MVIEKIRYYYQLTALIASAPFTLKNFNFSFLVNHIEVIRQTIINNEDACYTIPTMYKFSNMQKNQIQLLVTYNLQHSTGICFIPSKTWLFLFKQLMYCKKVYLDELNKLWFWNDPYLTTYVRFNYGIFDIDNYNHNKYNNKDKQISTYFTKKDIYYVIHYHHFLEILNLLIDSE